MTVKIRAQYTKDNRIMNGLESIANDMMADPLTRVTAIVVIEAAKTNVDHLNGGQRTLQVNLASIEPVFDGDAIEARNLLERAYKKRTGNPTAPVLFGDADELDDAVVEAVVVEEDDELTDEEAKAALEDERGDAPWDEGPPRANRTSEIFSDPSD